jgi:hypothetical protein
MSILVGSSVRIQGGSEGDRRGEFIAIDRSIIKDQCHEIFLFHVLHELSLSDLAVPRKSKFEHPRRYSHT